jgi:hypothetical protein
LAFELSIAIIITESEVVSGANVSPPLTATTTGTTAHGHFEQQITIL